MSQAIKELGIRLLLIFVGCVLYNATAFAQACPPGSSWCSGTYAYDAMGNIRAIGADTYVYDTAGRLVSGTADVQRKGVLSRQDYSYDAFGNRTGASRTIGSVDCPGGCELSPMIDQITNHIADSGAQYDAAGNLIFVQGTHNATYTYDAAGSLVRAVAGTDDRQFIYTADDERIATANGATWTWTVRGFDGKVLREFTSFQPQGGLPTSNWKWTKDYVWRDGLLLASVTPTASGGTATQHFHLDHLGTPRLVTGDNGVQLSVHAYYPFGAELTLTPTEQPAELMKFTGHERDLLANDPHTLDYMHARYEMGATGRFLSVDPVVGNTSNPQSWNRYTYARNNPVLIIDPKGLYVCKGQDDQCKTLKLALNKLKFDAARMSFADGRAEAQKIVAAYGTYGDPKSTINTVWIDPFKTDTNGKLLIGPDRKYVPLLGPGVIGQAARKGNVLVSFQNLKIRSDGDDTLAFVMLEGNLIHEGKHELQPGIDVPGKPSRHVLLANELPAYALANAFYSAMGFPGLAVNPVDGARHSVDQACNTSPGCDP